MIDHALLEAQAYYDAGNFSRGREVALQGIAERPDDLQLLRLAGRCSLALGLGDAVSLLRRVVAQAPDDPETWRDLGLALMDDDRIAEAADALHQAIRLQPNDASILVDLGHAAYGLGQLDAAIGYLSEAAERQPGNLTALRSLVEMQRRAGAAQQALDTATRIVHWRPDDTLAWIDIAGLNLSLGNLDDAVAAYSRLRRVDPEPEHEVYAYHGMIQAEMRRERWRRALDLAIDATRVDRFDLTTQVLAFVVAQVFGAGDRPAPDRAELEAALSAEQVEHRRYHSEALIS